MTSRAHRFWDRIAERYARQPIADEAAYEEKLRLTREYFRPDSEVLEFGCGTGSTALIHAPHVKHIRAIDVSAKMLDIARDKARAQNVDNVSFEQAAIDDFSVPAGSFDAVLGLSILHLLADKEQVIAKVYQMLKPGGVFVTSTSCIGGSLKMLPMRMILPVGRLFGLLPLVRFFTREELQQSITDAGFDIDRDWQPGKDKAVFIVAKKP